jgi:hypothetical protein
VNEGISPAQRKALAALAQVVDASTYLAGGVAVALRLHHRASRDLDLFVPSSDPTRWASALSKHDAVILTRAEGTLHIEIAGVAASLLRYHYRLLAPAEVIPGIEIPVASLDDLECMKLSAIAGRGALRDFWDLHALLTTRGRDLDASLAAYQRKFATDDIGQVVRSLVYFEDAEGEPRPAGLSAKHWAQIRADFTGWVGALH